MPFQRAFPALLLAAALLVLGTAQRMVLLWLLWPKLGVGPHDAFAALAHGARIDLACAAVVAVPLAAWGSILPERAWRSKLHRRLLGTVFVAGLLIIVSFDTIDGLQFFVNQARLAPPVRERLLVAWGLLAGSDSRAEVAAITALGCAAGAAGAALLLMRPFRAAFRGPVAPILRVRDLILVVTAGAIALVLVPHDLPFPGRPVLGEVSGSGVPALVALAESRAHRSLAGTSPRGRP